MKASTMPASKPSPDDEYVLAMTCASAYLFRRPEFQRRPSDRRRADPMIKARTTVAPRRGAAVGAATD